MTEDHTQIQKINIGIGMIAYQKDRSIRRNVLKTNRLDFTVLSASHRSEKSSKRIMKQTCTPADRINAMIDSARNRFAEPLTYYR
jgi:hypothetical protein